MTQLIADVLKRDEEERFRRATMFRRYTIFRDTPFSQGVYDDGTTRRTCVVTEDMQRRIRDAAAAWEGLAPNLDVAEFAMPSPAWDSAEYNVPAPRYRMP